MQGMIHYASRYNKIETMSNHYTINSRSYSQLEPLPQDLEFEKECAYAFDLSNHVILEVKGDNAETFLQGQLTCDMQQVTGDKTIPAALCNLQGRILALVDVLNDKGFKLVMHKDLLDIVIKTLSKPAMFSRVKLEINNTLTVIGLYPNQSADCTKKYELVPIHLKENYLSTLANKSQLAWHKLNLDQGVITIYPQTSGLFLPHNLGLHNTACVSLTKGCYKGQEIIARMHYKAKLKYEFKTLTFKWEGEIYPGDRLIEKESHKDIGELVDFCPLGNHDYLIAISVLIESTQNFILARNKVE